MRAKRVFVILFVLAIGITFYTGLSEQSFSPEEKPEVGFKAPAFTLKGLHTETSYHLENLEKPVVLNFWASWCDPCQAEAPDMVEIYDQYQDQIEIYAVNVTDTDTLSDVERFVETFGFDFPVLLDPTGIVSERYRVLAIPTTFFINRDGIVTAKHKGGATKQDFERYIQDLLAD